MQYDYKKMIEESGFLFPKLEETYDEIERKHIVDRRSLELQKVIRVAMNGFEKIQNPKQKLMFQTREKNIYELKVTKNSISCKNVSQKDQQEEREFLIKKEEENYVFKRLRIKENSILLEIVYITPPDYTKTIYGIIYGYDKETKAAFEKFQRETNILKYDLETFTKFLEQTRIKPDLQRKVSITSNSYQINFKEVDQTGEKEEKIIQFKMTYYSNILYPILESCIRARNFEKEINHLNGLSYSMEKKVEQYLKRNKI